MVDGTDSLKNTYTLLPPQNGSGSPAPESYSPTGNPPGSNPKDLKIQLCSCWKYKRLNMFPHLRHGSSLKQVLTQAQLSTPKTHSCHTKHTTYKKQKSKIKII